MDRFDFAAPCELFCARSVSLRSRVTYKRFGALSEAVRFAVEDLPADIRRSTTIEVSEVRLRGDEILALYESAGYPLKRKAKAQVAA